MTKLEYIENYGYISNKDFNLALENVRNYGIHIKDWKLPCHKKLNEVQIKLMIELRLHIKHNCLKDFKDNFWVMNVLDRNRGVYAVNYTGGTVSWDGNKFFGDYKFCIHKKRKPLNLTGEELFYINGSYPIMSCTSCLKEDIQRVKSTNYSWVTEEVVPVKIVAYKVD
jgi:hypothetical protein